MGEYFALVNYLDDKKVGILPSSLLQPRLKLKKPVAAAVTEGLGKQYHGAIFTGRWADECEVEQTTGRFIGQQHDGTLDDFIGNDETEYRCFILAVAPKLEQLQEFCQTSGRIVRPAVQGAKNAKDLVEEKNQENVKNVKRNAFSEIVSFSITLCS